MARINEPLPVPSTAIYSRTDGVVAWRSCLDAEAETAENVEVPGSHVGLLHNPAVFAVIADRLAQPEGAHRPFEPAGWMRLLAHQGPARGAGALMARMSRMDAAFLAMERPNLPGHLGTVMIFRPSKDGPLTYDAVLDTVAERLPLVPSARRVVAEVPVRPGAAVVGARPRLRPRVPRTSHRPPQARRRGGARPPDRPHPRHPARPGPPAVGAVGHRGSAGRPGRVVLQGPRRGDRRQHRRRADDGAARHRAVRAGRRSSTRSRSMPAASGPLDVVGRIVEPLPDQLRWAAGFPGRVAERAMRAAGEQWPGLRETAVEITQRTPLLGAAAKLLPTSDAGDVYRRAPDRPGAAAVVERADHPAPPLRPRPPPDRRRARRQERRRHDVQRRRRRRVRGDAAALAAGPGRAADVADRRPRARCSWPGPSGRRDDAHIAGLVVPTADQRGRSRPSVSPAPTTRWRWPRSATRRSRRR